AAWYLGRQLDGSVGRTETLHQKHIRYEHAAGDPPQQPRAKCDDGRKTVDELENQGATPDDDGYAQAESKNHISQLMVSMRILGGAGNGNNVVQTHGKVSNNNGANSSQYGRATGDVAVFVFGRSQQFYADPQQQHGARQFQEWNVEQDQRKGD